MLSGAYVNEKMIWFGAWLGVAADGLLHLLLKDLLLTFGADGEKVSLYFLKFDKLLPLGGMSPGLGW